ncbi:MAG: hypothetical protein JOZ97_08835 [Candidatus Eremiobacteraeota bacterium]|nr:hypothetical protein [Candidatus Eremiobacteraeota bacterium]
MSRLIAITFLATIMLQGCGKPAYHAAVRRTAPHQRSFSCHHLPGQRLAASCHRKKAAGIVGAILGSHVPKRRK